MDIIHQKIPLFTVIWLDVANNILKETVAWLPLFSHIAAAFTTIVIFAITATLVFSSASIFCFTHITCGAFWDWLLQLTVALTYYCGDNLPYIFHEYGEPLKCNESCQTVVRTVAMVLLLVSLVIQLNIPHKQQNWHHGEAPGLKDRQLWWIYAFNTVTVFLTTDIVYSVVALSISDWEHFAYIGPSALATCVIVGWLGIAKNFWYSQNPSGLKKKRCNCDIAFLLICIFLFASLPLHLLSDNEKPFDRIVGCRFNSSTNASLEAEQGVYVQVDHCSRRTHGLRLFLHILVAVPLILVSLLFLFRMLKERRHHRYKNV